MKSPIVIKLNGTLITGRIDGVESFAVTLRENDEDGSLAKSFTTELRFYDDGYNILKNQLIDAPNGFINQVDVQIFDECCGRLVFDGVINGDSIDWCEPECWVATQIVERKDVLNCVKSRLIYDDQNGFLDQNQKKVRYCVDVRPDFLLAILFLVYYILQVTIVTILVPIGLSLAPLSIIVFAICLIVCAIPGTDCETSDCTDNEFINPVELFDTIRDFLQDINARIFQCQFYHPTALVRDYIQNACTLCGLQFESSILNDPASPYYDLLLFSASVRKGYKPTETEGKLISDNLPVETIDTLMKTYLMPMFNAKYWIVGNRLIFERKDFFDGTTQWIDGEQMLNNGRIIENQICFSWIDRERPAYGDYKYSPDGSDLICNEVGDRFNEIVEWNSPPSNAQSESKDLVLLSSMSRYRADDAGPDNFRLFQNNTIISVLFGSALANSENLLLLSQHTPLNYKFLIWDSASGLDNARIKRSYSSSFTGGNVLGNTYNIIGQTFNNQVLNPNKLFNYPMWFKANNSNNLYSLFHYIDNPRLPGAKLFNFNFTFQFTCGEFDSIDFSKTVRLKVGNNVKFGQIKELQIDFVKRTIAVSGIV